MKHAIVIVLAGLIAFPALAQENSLLASRRLPVTIDAVGSYQSFDTDAGKISQMATPVSIGIPLGRQMRLRLVASQSSVSGDALATISGMNNMQVGLARAFRLGDAATLQVGANAGMPTGKTALTADQFATAILLSRARFRFAQPGFGQGLTVHPHAVLAIDLADNLVVGAGITYGYRQAFDPTETIADYDPGDEMLVTAGLNYSLNRVTFVSLDASVTLYTADLLAGETVMEAGQKTALLVQYRRRVGQSDLRVFGRYRSQATNLLRGIESPDATPPSLMEGGLRYGRGLGSSVSLGGSASVVTLSEVGCQTDSRVCLEAQTLFRVMVEPVVRVGSQLSLVARGGAVLGTTSGYEGGFGFRGRF